MTADPTKDFIPGLTLGDVLGGGAFGTVYAARHQMLDLDVAVKVIDAARVPALNLDQTLREARLMARLDHPNLLRVFDAGRGGGGAYLVLERMDGSCSGLRSLPPAQAVSFARQLLSGLQALHDARILHRDIKPANCLLRGKDGRVKLADLGIATEWRTAAPGGPLTGTLPFLAPELFDGPPRYDFRTDLYALGVTLACLLLPDDPFPHGGGFDAVRAWAVAGTRPSLFVARPDLPPEVCDLVQRLMAPEPADRPQTAAEALAALGSVQAPDTAPVQPAAPADSRSPTQTARPEERIGPWVLGETLFSSPVWLGRAVTHAATGTAARLMWLEPHGPIGGTSEFILAAAERASRLPHPGLTELLDWGLHDGQAFVVSEPHGRSLRDLVDGGGPVGEAQALGFLAPLADVLTFLHETRLVYQMVTPAAAVLASDARKARLGWSVFCVRAGEPVRSRSDGQSSRVGVPLYSAPEVVACVGDAIEPSVDNFGLGIIGYYLLAGTRNFSSTRSASGQLVGLIPPPDIRTFAPGVTAPTARLVADLMAPKPEDRPTAAQAKAEIERIARRLGVPVD